MEKMLGSILRPLLFLIPVVISTICFYWLVVNMHKGIDITDEGYYLSYSINASQHYYHGTNFAHYTGFIYRMLGNNLVSLRIFGVLALLSIATLWGYSILRYWRNVTKEEFSFIDQAVIYSVVASSVLTFYIYWIPTPSYNWLALVSCFLVSVGLLELRVPITKKSHLTSFDYVDVVASLFVGLGFLFAFMAKPTTALVLLLLTMIWLSPELSSPKKWLLKNIYIFFFTTILFCLHILIFEEGIAAYIELLRNAAHLRSTIREYEGLSALAMDYISSIVDVVSIEIFTNVPAIILLVTILVTNFIGKRFSQRFPVNPQFVNQAVLIALVVLVWVQLYIGESWRGGETHGSQAGSATIVLLFYLVFGAFLVETWRNRKSKFNSKGLRVASILVHIFILAFAYSFGSSNSFFTQSAMVLVFCFTALVLVAFYVDRNRKYKFLGIVVSVLVLTTNMMIIRGAIIDPYRLPTALQSQTEIITFINSKTELHVDSTTRNYVAGLQELALTNGWIARTPFIDMTGGTPLAAVILDAVPLGAAWLIGGYEGSDAGALMNLRTEERELLEAAWILEAPEGGRRLNTDILSSLQLGFPANYVNVGTVRTAHRDEMQILWMPGR